MWLKTRDSFKIGDNVVQRPNNKHLGGAAGIEGAAELGAVRRLLPVLPGGSSRIAVTGGDCQAVRPQAGWLFDEIRAAEAQIVCLCHAEERSGSTLGRQSVSQYSICALCRLQMCKRCTWPVVSDVATLLLLASAAVASAADEWCIRPRSAWLPDGCARSIINMHTERHRCQRYCRSSRMRLHRATAGPQ